MVTAGEDRLGVAGPSTLDTPWWAEVVVRLGRALGTDVLVPQRPPVDYPGDPTGVIRTALHVAATPDPGRRKA